MWGRLLRRFAAVPGPPAGFTGALEPAWFVQRRVPGRDGVVLQVRADPGTEPGALEVMVNEVVARLSWLAPPG